MADLKNELAWSFSRMRLFDSCRRRYYYQYYLKWDGWNEHAPEERQAAYRLSKMKTLDIYAGELVHQAIEETLKRFRNNNVVTSPEESIQTARLRWNKAIEDSTGGRYRRNAKSYICLLEDYYNHDDFEDRAERSWKRIEKGLTNFFNSKTWLELRHSRPKHWLAMDGDPFQQAVIDEIGLHARPDLGYGVIKDGGVKERCWVFDWKTGKPRDSDVIQLRYYALYAQQVWGFAAETVKARLVYLNPELIEQDVEVPVDGLLDARRVMAQSMTSMRSVLVDIEANLPHDISAFPITERTELCYQCAFQEICTDRFDAPMADEPMESDEEFDFN